MSAVNVDVHAVAPHATPEARRSTFLGDWIGLYWEPTRRFPSVIASARIWTPLAVYVGVLISVLVAWLSNVDLLAFLREHATDPKRLAMLEGDRQAEVLMVSKGVLWLAALASPLFVLALATLLHVAFALVLQWPVPFRRSLSVTAHGQLAIGFLSAVFPVVVMVMRGDWNADPEEIYAFGLRDLVAPLGVSGGLLEIAKRFDLFAVWKALLLAIGFSVAANRPLKPALITVSIVWIVYAVIAVALGLSL